MSIAAIRTLKIKPEVTNPINKSQGKPEKNKVKELRQMCLKTERRKLKNYFVTKDTSLLFYFSKNDKYEYQQIVHTNKLSWMPIPLEAIRKKLWKKFDHLLESLIWLGPYRRSIIFLWKKKKQKFLQLQLDLLSFDRKFLKLNR